MKTYAVANTKKTINTSLRILSQHRSYVVLAANFSILAVAESDMNSAAP